MDIERQNFLNEVEAENKKQNTQTEVKTKVVTAEKIDEIFNEAANKFGTTLKKLKD